MAARGVVGGASVAVPPPRVGLRVHRVASAIAHGWTARRDRPWISTVAVPLGMAGVGLLGQWWMWPALILSCVVTSRWRWSWVLSLELGYLGTEWTFVGAYALGTWPGSVVLIGVVWAAFPAVLAVAIAQHRHQSLVAGFRRPSGSARPEQSAKDAANLVRRGTA